MSKARIFSIGFEFPGGEVEYIDFFSDQSLLDADIIIYEPSLPREIFSPYEFEGKKVISESYSYEVVEALFHWRSELRHAVEAGKVVFIFLSKPEKACVYTGEKKYSGTGRNRIETRMLDSVSTYGAIPVKLTPVPSAGSKIRFVSRLGYLTTYWKEFSSSSPYKVYIECDFSDVLLRTHSGDRIVGAAFHAKNHGTFLFLPPISYDRAEFVRRNDEDGEEHWTEEAVSFGKRLISSIVEVGRALQSSKVETPPPHWSCESKYRFDEESELERVISAKTSQIEALQDEKSELQHELEQAGALRRLLYEKGVPLEEAIHEALTLFGFKTERYIDGESEFDAVFVSPEGRFLGEAEGKDNKPTNVDKLSQLMRNLHEDFSRDDVEDYAKGVLFGNAYRLAPIEERSESFTEKCKKGAAQAKIALVRTCDLVEPARYLKENTDDGYAKKCREVILYTEGQVVEFPIPPRIKPKIKVTLKEKNEASKASNKKK